MPQVVVDTSCFEELYPVNSIAGKSTSDLEFNIVASNTDYLDLNDTLLYVQVKYMKDHNTVLEDATVVEPVNLVFHTLFKDVILSLNNERIEGGNGTYMYKALIETILNYGNDTKNTSLSSIGVETTDNRKAWAKASKAINLCGSLQLDFFDQPKYLIPGVSVNLKLKRNETRFSCVATSKPIIEFNEAKLYVRRVKVEPSVLMGHQIGLNTKNAIYPIRKTQIVTYNIPTGASTFYKDQLFSDNRLPKFLLVTFQTNAQFNGAFTDSISEFKNLKVSSIILSRNNNYRESYVQDFDNNYTTSYVTSLIRNMGHLDKNINCGITAKDFKDKYPFFTFVLAPDFDIYTTQLPKHGNLKLDVKFGEALTASSVIIIYGIFDDEIQINKNRAIIYQ
jgi:hypothetical protein